MRAGRKDAASPLLRRRPDLLHVPDRHVPDVLAGVDALPDLIEEVARVSRLPRLLGRLARAEHLALLPQLVGRDVKGIARVVRNLAVGAIDADEDRLADASVDA